jgi:glycosyltransferase involved in cell wall biosynthesis
MITLITSRLQSKRPDLLLLRNFEKYCAENSGWKTARGGFLFSPVQISSRVYTGLHSVLQPFLKLIRKRSIVVSLGLPYQLYLYSKNFPYFTMGSNMRVLWTYDVWEPKYDEFEALVRKSGINLLMLSGKQATEYFSKLNIPGCKVHWVPESINPEDYRFKPQNERKIDILSFGRAYQKYHQHVLKAAEQYGLDYHYERRSDQKDVAVTRVNPNTLQFPEWDDFLEALSDSRICICFPKSMTHPSEAGSTSTITLRYLQAMASKCLIIGQAPDEAQALFNYNPVVEVDWNDPVGQLRHILHNLSDYSELIEKNYEMVCEKFHYKTAIGKMDSLIKQYAEKPEFNNTRLQVR